uniref:Uncharacterized protein n=1 Tax=Strombidinopsis acuminata TaxID=141414 RepID=A0A7S3U2Z7_9SPIT
MGAKAQAGEAMRRRLEKGGMPPKAILRCSGKGSDTAYIASRCKSCDGCSVEHCLKSMWYKNADGVDTKYKLPDLRYDLARGLLTMGGHGAKRPAAKPKAKAAVKRTKLR